MLAIGPPSGRLLLARLYGSPVILEDVARRLNVGTRFPRTMTAGDVRIVVLAIEDSLRESTGGG